MSQRRFVPYAIRKEPLNPAIFPFITPQNTTFTKPLHMIHTQLTHKLYSITRRARQTETSTKQKP